MSRSGFLVALAALAVSPAAFAGTLNVPGQYAKIQDAINAAVDGDVVFIANGTYKENIDLKGKAITLQGASRKGVTISGKKGGSTVTIASGEGPSTVLQSLAIKYGTGTKVGKLRLGGGIYMTGGSDPTLIDVAVGFNTADLGAGIYMDVGCDPTLEDCRVLNNNTLKYGTGGGLWVAGNPAIVGTRIAENSAVRGTGGGAYFVDSIASLVDCEVVENLADYGGGVQVRGGAPTITGNLFDKNSVLSATLVGEGAGLAIVAQATPWVSGNEFCHNTAHTGAGIYVYDSAPSIVSNLIHDNTASQLKGKHGYGGGINLGKGGGSIELNEIYANDATFGGGVATRGGTSTVLLSNVIDNNDVGGAGLGGGVYSKDSDPSILANTIALNNASDGGGLYVTGTKAPAADSSIIFFNTAGANASFFDASGLLTLIFCDVEAAAIGGSSLSIDPLFVNAAGRDFRLSAASPVIDAGNFGFSGGSSDVYGSTRINGGRVDMGAAEQ